MRFSLSISILAHSGVLALGLLTLPPPRMQTPDALVIVPVNLVTLAKTTNIRAAAPQKTTPAPEPPKKIEPPKVEPKPPEPEKSEAIAPAPKKEKSIPKPKPKPKPKKKAPPVFNLARLENKLQKQAHAMEQAQTDDNDFRLPVGPAEEMTASEADLLRAQMYQCWRAPLDAPDPARLRVTIRLQLNPDGTLNGPLTILNQTQIDRANDPFWRAAADNARRAVIKCQPYTLPPEKYATWRETIMHFNAADVVGQ